MGYETIGILLLTCASTLMAQAGTPEHFQAEHAREDEIWAKKTGLPASEVRAIRVAAGISDSTPVTHIDSIDADSLKQRNQILLVDGICVSLHVLERRADGFHQVWLLSKLPLPG